MTDAPQPPDLSTLEERQTALLAAYQEGSKRPYRDVL